MRLMDEKDGSKHLLSISSPCGAPDLRVNMNFGAGLPFLERPTYPIR